jgi:MFS family permease
LCFFLSQGVLVAALPLYAEDLGFNGFEIGVVLGGYFLSAILLRPFIGREIDRTSRKLFVAVGLIFSAVACFGYPFAKSFVPLVAVRLLHGVSIASFYSAAATITADIAPSSRRGEALSYFSMLLYAGSAVGPTIAKSLIVSGGFRLAFWTAAGLSAAGLVISLFLNEPDRQKSEEARGRLFHPAVTFPGVILTLASIGWAATSFIPLYAVTNFPVYFLTSSTTTLIMRLFVGRVADRFGRAAVIIPGIFIVVAALVVLSIRPSTPLLVAGALLFGIGWSALYPGLLSLTIDRVAPWERGSALGTLTAAFDLSTGIGQPALGFVLQQTSFPVLFLTGAMGPLAAGAGFLAWRKRSDAVYPVHEAAGF